MKFAEAPVPRDQINLIPTSLGDLIPDDHSIRLLDEMLSRMSWESFNERFRIEKRGRPPIPPQIMVAVWIYAFFRRIRSSRQLEYHLRTNIEFMWLAHGHQIDHSTLANFRRANKKAIKDTQKQLIRWAKDLEIVKIAELYVDGTRIGANSSRHHTMTADKASQLLNFVQSQIDHYLKEVEEHDEADDLGEEPTSGEQLPEHLESLAKRREQLEALLAKCNEMDAIRKKQGIDPQKNPFQLPLNDQDSRILPNKEGGYAPNYTPIIGVEGELGLIVSATVINSVNEQDYLVEMVDEVDESYGVSVNTVGADAAFSTGANITELEEERKKDFVSPHRNGDPDLDNPAIREDPTQPVADADLDKLPLYRGKFSSEAFVYDKDHDLYYCPQGNVLKRAYKETKRLGGGQEVTRTIYESPSCEGCALLSRCREGTGHRNGRRVGRDQYEEARAAHREKMSTAEAKKRYDKRFAIGERPFGQLKQGFGFRRFHTRGEDGVSSEFGLAVLAHNLLRLASHIGSIGNLRALVSKHG